ncbi:MAG: serine/threonine protein kinase, partial [Myxococcales bacterium]
MTKPSRLDAGTIVAGRYRVEREIGRGGMAQVYEARHTDIGKAVAVKVLAAEFASSPVVVERFLREARAAAAVHSPYICDVYDSGKLDDGRPFLVMELLKGESLYERMVKIRQFDAETTARVVTHVSRGLMKAHAASIVHRDLKPENIFLTVDEEGDLRAKVLDFGLAKFYAPTNDGDAASARLTREGAIFGTPAYMSPEQVQGQGTVDHRADLWALGCIAYECLTGRTVWATDKGIAMTFAQIASAALPKILRYRPDLPQTLEEWFERALARDPDVRFQTAKELAEHFNAAINQGSPSLMFGEISRVGPSPISDDLARQYLQGGEGSMPSSKRRPAAGEPAVPSGEVVSLGETPRAPSVLSPHPVTDPLPVSLRANEPPYTQPSPEPRSESLPGDLGISNTVNKPPVASGRRSRWPLLLVGVVGVAGGAVGAWQTMRSMGTTPAVTSASGLASTAPSAGRSATAPLSGSAAAPPVDSALLANAPRWWPLVQEGQAKVLAGDLPEAARRFKEAQDTMSSSVGKSMLDHVTVARDSKGPCKLTALTRLRSP